MECLGVVFSKIDKAITSFALIPVVQLTRFWRFEKGDRGMVALSVMTFQSSSCVAVVL